MLALVSLWGWWRATRSVDLPLQRLDVDLGADVSLVNFNDTQWGSTVAISPDGTRLAYLSGTPLGLFTRRLDQSKSTELLETQGPPFFSPDGQWVGFRNDTKLSKISVEGGTVVALGDLFNFGGASWSEDGSIIVSVVAKGLLRFPANGGLPETVMTLGKGELTFSSPQLLPGGKAIMFSAATAVGVDNSTVEVLTLADRQRKILLHGGQSPRYLPTLRGVGHLVYVNRAKLFAIPFDPDRLETHGPPVSILDDVAYDSTLGIGQLDFSGAPSGHGTLVYRRAGASAPQMMTLQWIDASGKRESSRKLAAGGRGFSISPDGKRIALQNGNGDISIFDPQRDIMTQLTSGGVLYDSPIWSPDGQYVVFASYGKGMFQARADGAGQQRALTELPENKAYQTPCSFTPDGKRLAYYEWGALKQQIWTMPLEDQGRELKAGRPEQFLRSEFRNSDPAFSPDGRWIAYQSDESGKPEVYVQAFPPRSSGPGGKWQISNSGGQEPRWLRNGRELVYWADDQIMSARYSVNGESFVPEKPRIWIDKLGGYAYDVAPDGRRVVVETPVKSTAAKEHEVTFLFNFFDELRRRAPAPK